MKTRSVLIDEEPAAPIRPEMLTKLKKEDMQQAVVERFKVKVTAAAPGAAAKERKRSPRWQASDEER